jgi:hypothetical protein
MPFVVMMADLSVGRSLTRCGCRNGYVDEYLYPRIHVRPKHVVPVVIIRSVIVATIVITIMALADYSLFASLSYHRQPPNNRRTSGCAHTGVGTSSTRGERQVQRHAGTRQRPAPSEPSGTLPVRSTSLPWCHHHHHQVEAAHGRHPAEHLPLRITALGCSGRCAMVCE